MFRIVVIPEERKPILIGVDGSVKKKIEFETKTRLSVIHDIKIEGETLNVLKAEQVVKAIGNGFSPKKAFFLLKDEYVMIVIPYEFNSIDEKQRIIARVIGRRGTTRKNIEEKTKTFISVYGKSISIIGKEQHIFDAERSIESLLAGKSHGYAYRLADKSTK